MEGGTKEGLSEREHRGQTEGWQKTGPKTEGVGLTEAWVSTGLRSLETGLSVQLVTVLSLPWNSHPQEDTRS